MSNNKGWIFTDESGTFQWKNPFAVNQLYFPLCNEAGMMSSVTPTLNGDAKTNQNTFLLLPVNIEDLHNNRSSRNFWIYNEQLGSYSLTRNSAAQRALLFTRKSTGITVEGGFFISQAAQ